MDYGKSGNANQAKPAPSRKPQKGKPDVAYGQPPDKAALLARIKAAAQARKG